MSSISNQSHPAAAPNPPALACIWCCCTLCMPLGRLLIVRGGFLRGWVQTTAAAVLFVVACIGRWCYNSIVIAALCIVVLACEVHATCNDTYHGQIIAQLLQCAVKQCEEHTTLPGGTYLQTDLQTNLLGHTMGGGRGGTRGRGCRGGQMWGLNGPLEDLDQHEVAFRLPMHILVSTSGHERSESSLLCACAFMACDA